MAVTIQMGKAKAKQQATAAVAKSATVFDPEVDELAELLEWAAKQAKSAKAVRLAELKKKFAEQIKTEYEDEPDRDDIVIEGEKNRYEFGKASTERKVTTEGVGLFFEKVGEEAFKELVTVPIGALDNYVPKVEQDDYVAITRGSRTAKMVKKTD